MDLENEKIYGLIGYPLGHSFSQIYFNKKFEDEKINARYLNFEIPDIGDLMEIVSEYPNLQGLNVTIPYKQQVIPFLMKVDEQAKRIGAVNLIKVVHRGDRTVDLIGYNSDIVGFENSIASMINDRRRKALVLGTGGASKAVRCGLENLGVEVRLVSRTKREGVLTDDELTPDIMKEHRVIVNTTPLGMYPHVDECPDIPYSCLTSEHLCYDVIYNPDITLFMRKSAEYGAETKNGLEMLLLQAFENWRVWNESQS